MKNPPSRSVILLVWAAILATLLIAGSDPVSGQASKQVQSVGTLGDLKARRPVVREVIEVRNGSSTNLWAAPRTFVHDPDSTDSADDVYVVTNAAASGRYTATDRSTGIIDPRHFGAIPDDLYDDTTPMLAAFAAAGTRASVYIPQGRFIITSPLPLVDRLHVHGEGDGSMIAVGNTNGIAFWNATPGTRVYEVFLENFAINTALGARGNIAISLTNVSYARIEKVFIHAYDGLGFRVGVSPWGDSPSSVGGAWSSSMTGCKIYVYPRPGEPAYAFYGDGGPEWGHGPNSWRIIDNYLNIQPVIAGGITNYGTAVAYANNQNGIQFTDNIFEGYYTNSILMEGGAASSVIGNRFEVSYGIGGTNFAAIRMNNMTNVFIAGNMSQGLGDVTKYVRGVNSSYTLFDAASGSPNTIDGDLILGKTWNVDNTGYLPTVDRFLLLDSTEPLTTMGIGLRTIDSTTNNPRAVMTLNANPTNGQSWAGIWHASTPGAIPFYFYQQNQTNLAITATGSGVLGLPTTSAALSVYGNGAFGSAPAVTGGWTDMSEGVWVRTTDLADKAGFHAIINDGVTNRRIEMKISSTNAAISTTATTAGLPLDLWVSGVNPFSVDTTGVRIKTNLFFSSGTSLFLGGDTIDDFTGAGLSVVGGKLTASGGTGDVVGPASSTDATLAVFMGTSGKALTNAPAIAATNVQTITAAVAAYEPLNANKYQSTNANLTALAGAGSTGSGAFVRADSPTLSGTWAFDALNAGTLTVTNPFPASGITNPTASRFAVFGADNRLTNDVAETGTGAPVRATSPALASPALTGTPTVNGTNLMAAVHERVLRAGDTMTGALALAGDSTAPTPTAGDADTSISTTAFVAEEITDGSYLSKIKLTDELISPSSTIGEGGTIGTANGGTVGFNNSEAGRQGLRFVRSNTTNDAPHWGWATTSGAYPFYLTTGEYHFCEIIQKGPAATTDTDSYENRAGFLVAVAGTNGVTDGAYFIYSTNLASGSNWGFVNVSNTVASTVADTGVAYDGTASYVRLGVRLTATNSIGYINGTAVATNTTRMPVGRRFGAASQQGRYWGTANLDTVIDRFVYKWEGASR